MNLWILTLSHLLNVLGTVVWIGGILMTLLVILPGSKAAIVSAPMVGNLMKEVAKRFTPLANIRTAHLPIEISNGPETTVPPASLNCLMASVTETTKKSVSIENRYAE
jgi:uncharacterized membrane protein